MTVDRQCYNVKANTNVNVKFCCWTHSDEMQPYVGLISVNINPRIRLRANSRRLEELLLAEHQTDLWLWGPPVLRQKEGRYKLNRVHDIGKCSTLTDGAIAHRFTCHSQIALSSLARDSRGKMTAGFLNPLRRVRSRPHLIGFIYVCLSGK